MELAFEAFDVFELVSHVFLTLRDKIHDSKTSIKVIVDMCTKKRLSSKNISSDKSRIMMILGKLIVWTTFACNT